MESGHIKPTHNKAVVCLEIHYLQGWLLLHVCIVSDFFYISRDLVGQYRKGAGRFSSQMAWEEWEWHTLVYYSISV